MKCRVCGNELKQRRERKSPKSKPKPELPPVEIVRDVKELLKDDDD